MTETGAEHAADDIRRAFAGDAAPLPDAARDAIFRRAAKGAKRTRAMQTAGMVGAIAATAIAIVWAYTALQAPNGWDGPVLAGALVREEGRAPRTLAAGERLIAGRAEVEVVLSESTTIVAAPASVLRIVDRSAARVALERGSIEARGRATIETEGCSCRVTGRSRVSATPFAHTSVVIIAGTVETHGAACTVSRLDLDEPAASRVPSAPPDAISEPNATPRQRPARHAHANEPAAAQPIARTVPPPSAEPDPQALIAERVDRFERARARIATDPARAAQELRILLREWPQSPIDAELRRALSDAEAAERGP